MKISKRTLEFFSTLADETRLKILFCLTNGGKSVGKIYENVGKNKMTLSAISHQLKQMENLHIVDSKKLGREKIFTLSEEFCWCILKNAVEHFDKKTKCQKCANIKENWKEN
jgi:DNA-binding transcriptional ArsR family regulator